MITSAENRSDTLLPTTRDSGKREQTESPEEKYRVADKKLLRLENELDVLLHCEKSLREDRTYLTDGRLKYTNKSPNEAILDDRDRLVHDYLELADKSKALDMQIKKLKEECASARSHCNYLFSKIAKPFPTAKGYKRGRELHDRRTLPHGGPESGFIDREAVAERILVAESTAYSVGGVVGAFGAGISYTTLFSATRGRLDLIAWAFTSFVVVVMNCAALQVFALPRHGQVAKIFRMEYSGSAEQKLMVFILLVGVPMVTGFLLLAMSVALLDAAADQPVLGSQLSIRTAGYLPVVPLGYFVIAMILTALIAVGIRLLSQLNILLWPTEHMPEESRKHYPSLLFAVKDKLFFLPGGPGYSRYREKRLELEGRKA